MEQSDAPLLKRTLIMVGAMLGSCVLFVGTLCLISLLIVGKVVAPAGASAGGASGAVVPAENVHGGAAPSLAAQPTPHAPNAPAGALPVTAGRKML